MPLEQLNNVIRSGADLKTVMELAWHSSAKMSMDVYAKPKPSLLKNAVASVAAKIKARDVFRLKKVMTAKHPLMIAGA